MKRHSTLDRCDYKALVRMSLRDLTSRIDAADFTQVHRGVLVNTRCILSATRGNNGLYRARAVTVGQGEPGVRLSVSRHVAAASSALRIVADPLLIDVRTAWG